MTTRLALSGWRTNDHGTRWRARSISGPEGFIFDLLQLVDLDQTAI
jgi:hypothetical protein